MIAKRDTHTLGEALGRSRRLCPRDKSIVGPSTLPAPLGFNEWRIEREAR